ncbi:MAG: C4-dicarboxylate ABC transporter, partial [Rhodobacteraceae bacterium]|nr:C4-dicarboxylate ABC transporter [Paracoccaceae bacterium]
SKGVIDGTVIPWEVTPSIRLAELAKNHLEFGGKESLYTATIIMVMNKAKYESLPEDVRAAIDAESGMKLAEFAAQVMYDYDKPGRDIAVAAGNTITTLDEAEVARWKEKAKPVVDTWVADMQGKGIDGAALIEQAKALIAKHGG